MQRGIDLGDFIQQDRAAVGRLEAAGPRGVGPRERALLVAEELALHQLRREHRAIQADHRRRVAMAGRVDRAGDEFLAGAALAHDEHGFRRRPHLKDSRPQRLHERAGTDHGGLDLLRGGKCVRLRMDQSSVPHCLGHKPFQGVGLKRFFNVVEGPVPHRFNRRGHSSMGRDHDNLRRALPLPELDDELDARHARHFQVGDDAIEAHRFEQLQGLGRASAALHLVARMAQHVGHRLPRAGVIVDDKYAAGGHSIAS